MPSPRASRIDEGAEIINDRFTASCGTLRQCPPSSAEALPRLRPHAHPRRTAHVGYAARAPPGRNLCRWFFPKPQSIRFPSLPNPASRPNPSVLDPGFGFGKRLDENFVLLRQFAALRHFGLPLLGAVSRKRFLVSHIEHPTAANRRRNSPCAANVRSSSSPRPACTGSCASTTYAQAVGELHGRHSPKPTFRNSPSTPMRLKIAAAASPTPFSSALSLLSSRREAERSAVNVTRATLDPTRSTRSTNSRHAGCAPESRFQTWVPAAPAWHRS